MCYRTNILTYIHVLYALILDYENIHKHLTHEFIVGLIEMEGDQSELHCRFLLNIAKYYRSSIEHSHSLSINSSSSTLPTTAVDIPSNPVQYLTAEQVFVDY